MTGRSPEFSYLRVAVQPGHVFRYAYGNGLERFVVTRCAQVGQIRLGKRLVAAFQFIRERNVLDAAFLVVRQRCVSHRLEGFRAARTQVEDTGHAVFPEPQVYGGYIAHINEVTLEAVAAFKQFWAFAIIQLGVQVERYARHAAFVAFARPVDVEVAEADNLGVRFWQDLTHIIVEQEFGVTVDVQRL